LKPVAVGGRLSAEVIGLAMVGLSAYNYMMDSYVRAHVNDGKEQAKELKNVLRLILMLLLRGLSNLLTYQIRQLLMIL
jgi:uncharacterized membrane protein